MTKRLPQGRRAIAAEEDKKRALALRQGPV